MLRLISCTGSGGSGSAARQNGMKQSTHEITAERRPSVHDAPGRVGQQRQCRRVEHALRARLAPLPLGLLGLGPRELDLPAEQLVEEAQVGLDEDWVVSWTLRSTASAAQDSPFSRLARVMRYASMRPRPLYFMRYAICCLAGSSCTIAWVLTTILALRDTPTRQWTSTQPPEARACSIHSHARAMTGRSGSLPSSLTSVRSRLMVSFMNEYKKACGTYT